MPDKRVTADIFIDKKIITYDFIKAGFGKPAQCGDLTSPYYEGFQEAYQQAKEEENGFFAPKDHKKIHLPKIEDLVGKKITGIFEEMNYERDFSFWCFET